MLLMARSEQKSISPRWFLSEVSREAACNTRVHKYNNGSASKVTCLVYAKSQYSISVYHSTTRFKFETPVAERELAPISQ